MGMVLMKIKNRHQVFTDIEFFFIWVSLSHRVQFLQQLHMCARNDWPGKDKFLLITTPCFFRIQQQRRTTCTKKKKKKKSTLRFHHLSLTYKLYMYTFTYVINMWKKIPSNCDTQLRRHAECKYWFSTRNIRYIRTCTTHVHTNRDTHTHFFFFFFFLNPQ